MPGRVSTRKSQSAPGKSRVSTRIASPNIDIPIEGESSTLREEICAIFAQAQRSTAGSRKLVVGLRKIQEACCYEPTQPRKRVFTDEFDENDFTAEVLRCIVRLLQIKKSEPCGDRLVRFLGLFLKFAADADNVIFKTDDSVATFPETPSSRLSSQIISKLLALFTAKDKAVRFRCTQIVAHLVNTLDSIDDELFHPIRLGLLKRLRDKESQIRAQAVYGLGRLASDLTETETGDDSDDDGIAGSVLEKLLDVLQNDPSGEVRRSLLLNLPFTPTTLPYLLERARDIDAPIRRALYSRLLPALADFRHLSLTHREKLLRWGLRDRDEHVKKATARLFRERWIEDCARQRNANGQPADATPGVVSNPSLTGLSELLERIDVVNSGTDGGIGLDAMRAFWEGRPDYGEFITFDEAYWKELTPESVFIARTFNDFCRGNNVSAFLQDKMPEVTRFAFLLQENVNRLVEEVRKAAVQEGAEEDTVQQEFVVEQLLNIALTLDYSDEIGRRTMFSLLREALALAELPEEITRLATNVLRTACGKSVSSEKEFIAVVLEAIAEVHDTIMGDEPLKVEDDGDESFHSAKSEVSEKSTPRQGKIVDSISEEEKAVREIMVNMKCLHIAQCMLQNIDCELEKNTDLVTMLNNLVVPAVRSQEAPIRERGLLCLGLCCLLDKNLAEENLTLFLHCFNKGHEALQNIAIQIIGDILNAHPLMLLSLSNPAVKTENAESPGVVPEVKEQHPLRKPIHKLFSKALNSSSAPIQSTACTALCKLMLSSPTASSEKASILDHDELLRMLTIAYFDPEMTINPGLRQTLSYFIPVYCHSRKENLQRMGRIAVDVLHWCVGVKDEMEGDEEAEAAGEMVGLTVIIAHLVDWTDGRKLAAALSGSGDVASGVEEESEVHLRLAREILEKVVGVCSKEERKLYISMLGKLHVSSNTNVEQLNEVAAMVSEAIQDKSSGDSSNRNTLLKVQTALSKALKTESRIRSVAPSVAGEGEDDDAQTVMDEDGSDEPNAAEDATVMIDETMLQDPVDSPQKPKRAKSAGRPSIKPRGSNRLVANQAGPEELTRGEARAIDSGEGTCAVNIKEEEVDINEQLDQAVDANNVPPATHKTSTTEDMATETAAAAVTQAALGRQMSVQAEPARRPRGRPPKTTAGGPRQSVRSGRRRLAATSEGSGTGNGEEAE